MAIFMPACLLGIASRVTPAKRRIVSDAGGDRGCGRPRARYSRRQEPRQVVEREAIEAVEK
jgi:hypothetical protein